MLGAECELIRRPTDEPIGGALCMQKYEIYVYFQQNVEEKKIELN